VTGVDPAPVMLQLARALTRDRPRISWLQGAAEDLRLPDGSATLVWGLATVHHWRDATAGLAEAQRVPTFERGSSRSSAGCVPVATGLASHGWTDQQAESFAAQCRAAGFNEIRIEAHTPGRRALKVVVTAVRP
jgi:SAM-dependent methyltransferase